DSNSKSSMMTRMTEPICDQSSIDVDPSGAACPLPVPPSGSQITIERFPDGLTIQIPPAGLWRGTKGLFFFAVAWNGFLLVLTPCLLGAVLGNDGKNRRIMQCGCCRLCSRSSGGWYSAAY